MDDIAVFVFHVPFDHLAEGFKAQCCPLHDATPSIGVFNDPCAGMGFAEASLNITVGGDRDPVLGVTV